MKARRMRGLAACAAAAIVVVITAAAVAAAGSSPVREIAAQTWNEARAVQTPAALRAATPQVRALVTTPTIEVVQFGVRGPRQRARYSPAHGQVRRACYDVWMSTTRLNVFGAVVMQARTTIHNWCNNGTTITSQPTVQRSISAQWGWAACGWNDDYAGWLHTNTRFGAGGAAMFAFGTSCTGAAPQSRHGLQLRGDGTYDMSN